MATFSIYYLYILTVMQKLQTKMTKTEDVPTRRKCRNIYSF